MTPFDEKVQKALHERTNPEVQELQSAIWKTIEQKNRWERKQMKTKRILPLVIAIVAALAIVLGLQTDSGMALMHEIKTWFVPEKKITQNIEGHDEQTNVHLNEGTNYILYIDEERYAMTKGEEADVITTKDSMPEGYPPVTMEIKQVPDTNPETLLASIEAELKKEFPDLRPAENVDKPVKGYWLHGINGQDAKSPVIDVYIISNEKNGSFIITERYFLEAAEGHGARFYHMLESFEIIDED